ncbi:helix-turn-helix domain-containing protein [Acinetobacter baumannii]|uniref:helix-turn-helix domain-containing protein n=1 Tax=Acinetobacter baumannii TaxID=470 RepID=UPI002448906D|nr:AraC family transcriptional regulator [Acinetobacter baumannii]MDH2522849.1 AraC family transcriptional regulator [Acinetobacter baumannii]
MFNQLSHPQVLVQYLYSRNFITRSQYQVLKAQISFSHLAHGNYQKEIYDIIIENFLKLNDPILPFLPSNNIDFSDYPLLDIGINIQKSYYDIIQFYLNNHDLTTPLSNIKFIYKAPLLLFTVTPILYSSRNTNKYIFSVEYHLSEILNLIKKHIPSLGHPFKVTLKYATPQHIPLYHKIFYCNNIEFNAEQNTIFYHVNENEIFCTRNSLTYIEVSQKISTLLKASHNKYLNQSSSIKEKVIYILDCYNDQIPSEITIAKELNMHERTLRRKLKLEGETFRNIVTNFKKEKAIKLLMEKRLTQKQIAIHLGFKDTNSFGRAFKIWTGKTLKDFNISFHN